MNPLGLGVSVSGTPVAADLSNMMPLAESSFYLQLEESTDTLIREL